MHVVMQNNDITTNVYAICLRCCVHKLQVLGDGFARGCDLRDFVQDLDLHQGSLHIRFMAGLDESKHVLFLLAGLPRATFSDPTPIFATSVLHRLFAHVNAN